MRNGSHFISKDMINHVAQEEVVRILKVKNINGRWRVSNYWHRLYHHTGITGLLQPSAVRHLNTFVTPLTIFYLTRKGREEERFLSKCLHESLSPFTDHWYPQTENQIIENSNSDKFPTLFTYATAATFWFVVIFSVKSFHASLDQRTSFSVRRDEYIR